MRHGHEIAAIAIPAIVSNITTPVLGLVDIAVAGRIGEAVFIAAIAVGGTMFNLLYWMLNFLRMGTGGLTAQAFGASDRRRITLTLLRSVVLAAGAGAVLMLAGRFIADVLLEFLKPDSAVGALARIYFDVCIFGAPAVMFGYVLSGWFIGMQNSRAPMWMAVLTNVVNILLSPLLVFRLVMGIEGIAVATLAGQWSGLLLGVFIMLKRYTFVKFNWREVFDTEALVRFFRVNTDIFLRTVCLVGVTLWFTHAGAIQGTGILAANALLLQLFMLTSFFMDGIAFAGEALGGKYSGRGDVDGLQTLVASLLRLGLLCALTFSLVFAIGGKGILSLLADSRDVVDVALEYLPWAVAVPLCGFMAFVFDGVFIGLTRTRAMLTAMIAASLVFFAVFFSLTAVLKNNALWLAFDIYLLLRGIVEYVFFRMKCGTKR